MAPNEHTLTLGLAVHIEAIGARTFRPTDARSWDHREPENGGLPRAAGQAALNSAAPRILDIGGSVEEEVRRALGGGIRGLAAAGAVHTDITKEGSPTNSQDRCLKGGATQFEAFQLALGSSRWTISLDTSALSGRLHSLDQTRIICQRSRAIDPRRSGRSYLETSKLCWRSQPTSRGSSRLPFGLLGKWRQP
jgi:hypothetical protein